MTHPCYRFADLIVGADFPLPELPETSGRPAIRIRMGERRRRDSRQEWRHRWRQPGGPEWMRVAVEGDAHIVQYPGGAEFHVRDSEITCHPRVGLPAYAARHLLLDLLLPAIMASHGRLVLHASGVRLGNRAVGFIGRAGAGKSTIAAALTRFGGATLSDDALVLDFREGLPVAIPTYPGVRLWPDSRALFEGFGRVQRTRVSPASRKERWFGANVPFSSDSAPLAALFVLDRGARAQAHAMPPVEAMMALVRFSMMLDPTDRVAVGRGFELAARIVERVPIRRLAVPRRRGGLAHVSALIAASPFEA